MSRRKVYSGEIGSIGLAVGPACYLSVSKVPRTKQKGKRVYTATEIKRLGKAISDAVLQIRNQQKAVQKKGKLNINATAEALKILESHELLITDPEFLSQVESIIIQKKVKAETAFQLQIQQIIGILSKNNNRGFKDKERDLKDITRIVVSNLQNKFGNLVVPLGAVVFVKIITPQLIFQLKERGAAALITTEVSPPEHVLILSRALRLPLISGISYVPQKRSRFLVIVDCFEGNVITNPSLEEIQKVKHRNELLLNTESKILKLPEETCCKSGEKVKVSWNVELPEEISLFSSKGIKGVGLFRSEYLYLKKDVKPTLKQQEESYLKAAEAFPEQNINIRLFDLGGDKNFHIEDEGGELNDFLGVRAIRYLIQNKDILEEQLKAIIAAHERYPNIRIMIPFLSAIEDFDTVKEMVSALTKKKIALGVMIETPAAIDLIKILKPDLDFLCVGTNDLLQYLTAANRNSRSLSGYLQPMHESLLQSLIRIKKLSQKLEVTICGEISAQVEYLPVLLGLGYNSFSVSPANSGILRLLISQLDLQDCKDLLDEVLDTRLLTGRQKIIQDFISRKKIRGNPDLVLQD